MDDGTKTAAKFLFRALPGELVQLVVDYLNTSCLLIYGGIKLDGKTCAYAYVLRLDEAATDWKASEPMAMGCMSSVSFVVGNELVVFGESGTMVLPIKIGKGRRVESFGSWREEPSWYAPFSSFDGHIVEKEMKYYVAVCKQTMCTETKAWIKVLDLPTMKWMDVVKPVADEKFYHRHKYDMATVVWKGLLVFIGGYNNVSHASVDVEAFDPANKTWITLPPLCEPRKYGRAIILGNQDILLMGGTSIEEKRLSSCEIFSMKNNRWIKSSLVLPVATDDLDAYVVDGLLCIVNKGHQWPHEEDEPDLHSMWIIELKNLNLDSEITDVGSGMGNSVASDKSNINAWKRLPPLPSHRLFVNSVVIPPTI